MSNLAIRVDQVTKRFRLYQSARSGPLQAILAPRRHAAIPQFTAVDQVSFEVQRGEVVGMLGHNGSGKSTLLKMVAGLLEIDSGRIDVRGRLSLLIALGVGVHPEFTGRENIIYGAMLLGMAKREVLRKMDAIIEFAEIGDYIDQPFRTYSNGMKSRVLFATAMSVDPEIMIVDEALATGDSQFVEKCLQRIREVCRSGATVLFVSHNLHEVSSLCRRCLLMDHGRLIADGPPDETIAKYISLLQRTSVATTETEMPALFAPCAGTGQVSIRDGFFRGAAGATRTLHVGQDYELVFELEATAAVAEAGYLVELRSLSAATVYAVLPSPRPIHEPPADPLQIPAGRSRLVLTLPTWQGGDGGYSFDVQLHRLTASGTPLPEGILCRYERPFRFSSGYSIPRVTARETLMDLGTIRARIEVA